MFLYSFSCVLPKFKARLISPDFRVEADLAKMHHATNLSYSDGQPIAILSHNHHTLPPHATYMKQGLLSRGPKAVTRMDIDLPM